jgi:hypothetical protein
MKGDYSQPSLMPGRYLEEIDLPSPHGFSPRLHQQFARRVRHGAEKVVIVSD